MLNVGLLTPVIGLVAWTFVMWAWMYATRLPAMRKARMKPDPNAARGEQMSQLPPEVRWKADNYNHLMEQPTLFYAATVILALTAYSMIDVALAWAFVGLRLAHSIYQATVNKVQIRGMLFGVSSLVMLVIAVRTLLAVLSLPSI